MKRIHSLLALSLLLIAAPFASATVFATVHGVVHDPQHRPVAGAQVTLQASGSAFVLRATTDADGAFELPQAPIGVYSLQVEAPGFSTSSQPLTLASGTNPTLHIPLQVSATTQSVIVHASGEEAPANDSVTPTTLITRADISP